MLFLLALVGLVAAAPQPTIRHPMGVGYHDNSRIVGGKDAVKGAYPWQVTLQRSSGSHFCGGSLVSTTHVISAAHCQVSLVNVGLGALDYHLPEQLISQKTFIPHPQYNSAGFDYDYAVIVLASPARLGENVNVGTIKMEAHEAGKDYTGMAHTSGWGYTTNFNQATPDIMQESDIPLVSRADCQAVWNGVITITDQIQCAGGDSLVSSCMGDSGGPLTIERNGETILIGAVSWVESRCRDEYPGGYAKISAVRNWIDSVMVV